MSGNASFIILYRVCLREVHTGDRKRQRRGFVIMIQRHTDRGGEGYEPRKRDVSHCNVISSGFTGCVTRCFFIPQQTC